MGKVSERELRERTLTSLYNALNVWQGVEKIKVVVARSRMHARFHYTLGIKVVAVILIVTRV